MIIQFPNNFKIDDYNDKFLWRYIDLHKLIDLLNKKQIYFTRFDHFEDGVEGLTGKGVSLKAFTQGEPITMTNVGPNLTPEQKEITIRQDKNWREMYLDEITGSQQTQFASCWFLGDRESLAMWKLYSRKEGVAIKFKARQLIDTLVTAARNYTSSAFHIMYLGQVAYKNIWPFDPLENFDGQFNGLNKDRSYLHENEFRFVSVVPITEKAKHNNFTLPIGELNTFDFKIITNPFMEKYEMENLKTLLGKYELENYLIPSRMEIRK